MKINLIPESIPMQEARYVRKNGSTGAQVQRLMRQMERETNMMIQGESAVNRAEDFPNHIHMSSSEMVKKLLDII